MGSDPHGNGDEHIVFCAPIAINALGRVFQDYRQVGITGLVSGFLML